MWSAWVSKSTHAHSSGQPAAHSAGGWFLPEKRAAAVDAILHVTTHTASPMTTTLELWWENNLERISTKLKGCWVCAVHEALLLFWSNAVSFISLAFRGKSRGHALGLWRRRLVNSASWHATVGDTLPSLHHRLHLLPHGCWEPQVRPFEKSSKFCLLWSHSYQQLDLPAAQDLILSSRLA